MPPALRPSSARLTGVTPMAGAPAAPVRTGEPLTVRVAYAAETAPDPMVVEVFYYSADGRVLVCQQTTAFGDEPLILRPPGGIVEFTFSECPLQPGQYAVAACLRHPRGDELLSWCAGPPLAVRPGRMVRGQFYAAHTWRHLSGEGASMPAPTPPGPDDKSSSARTARSTARRP